MDFNVSIGDDKRDTRILAPWFLNCLNKVSNSDTSKFVLKHKIFGMIPMNAYKANLEKYKKYVNLQGDPESEAIVNMVVDYLHDDELIQKSSSYPAEVAITQKGIDKCNEPKDIKWSYNHIFYTIKDDDDIVKEPGYSKYK